MEGFTTVNGYKADPGFDQLSAEEITLTAVTSAVAFTHCCRFIAQIERPACFWVCQHVCCLMDQAVHGFDIPGTPALRKANIQP